MSTPTRCVDVTYDMRTVPPLGNGDDVPAYTAEIGDLLWNPKGGHGHVLVREERCQGGHPVDCGCGGWILNDVPHTTLICECGEADADRDHHYFVIARSNDQETSSMYVTPSFRCPDEGEDIILLTVNANGDVGSYHRTNRRQISAAVEVLRAEAADKFGPERDGGQVDADFDRRDLLHVLQDLLGEVREDDPHA